MGKTPKSDTIQTMNAQETIKEAAEKLLGLMGIGGEIAVSEDKGNETFLLDIKTEDSAILIGRHGDTIDSLQTILGQIAFKKTDVWYRIIVDVDGYRDKQKESLVVMASEIAEQVKNTGQPQTIFDLTASQRRIMHMTLAENPDVLTESQGEGRERYLVVKPKT